MKTRTLIAVGAMVVTGGIVTLMIRHREVAEPRGPATVAHVAVTAAPALAAPGPAAAPDPEAMPYPVDLDDLRVRLPDNRYWQLGAPTSDPTVARARAERAKRANDTFGRTQTGEATRQEIREYYAEQRRVSEDYLQLSLIVLAEKGDKLPERDRGLFELSAQLHRARLQQIDRDLAGALARRDGIEGNEQANLVK